jgi:ATP-dependent Clp protease ATP-binding subunit ClpB
MAAAAYDPIYGARPLRRYLQTHLETRLAKEIIAGRIEDGAQIVVDVQDGHLVFGYEDEDGGVVFDAEVTPAAPNVDGGRAIQ